MYFYTNFHQYKGYVLLRGYRDGRRIQEKIKLKPYLFVETEKQTKYKNVFGKSVGRLDFDSTFDARNFIKENQHSTIYGMTNYHYVFINDEFKGNVEYNLENISIVSLDIETLADGGFPDIQKADKEITAITMKKKGRTYVLGLGDYTPHRPDTYYIKCKDEADMLRKFVEAWEKLSADVVTGWNIEFFDIPYLINRISRIVGRKYAERLSPWGILEEKMIYFNGKDQQSYAPVGVSIIDYMQAYKKFSFKNEESYKLDHIAKVVLDAQKLDYSEYGSLHQLYLKDFQKYVEYNVHDTDLIDRLEDKLGFIKQIILIAYIAKVNYPNSFTSVRLWDSIIHNYLMSKNIVVNPGGDKKSTHQIAGGYVKHPMPGQYPWVVSFDLNSLYPHLIMQYNISPETLVKSSGVFIDIDELVKKGQYEDWKYLVENKLTVCPTGCYFTTEKRGFMPELMDKFYNDRKKYQAELKKTKRAIEAETDKDKKVELERQATVLHNVQLAIKIMINSMYGASANLWFRWFDEKLAESITLSGQLSIKWIEKYLNIFFNDVFGTNDKDYIIAMDTDSVYVNMENVARVFKSKNPSITDSEICDKINEFCEKHVEKAINDAYKSLAVTMNAYEQKMVMKRENIANKGIWTAKKRYILNVMDSEGIKYAEPKLKMVGIEAIRSSTPETCRKALKEAIFIIMNKDQNALVDYVEEYRNKFSTLKFHEVAMASTCNGLNEYGSNITVYKKGTPMHVRAALTYNKLLKDLGLNDTIEQIYEGNKIKFSLMRVPNPTREDVLACPAELAEELGMSKYIDYDAQFNKVFVEPLKGILDPIGWSIEKQMSLNSFFE
jgi:DNA polymerase elongation subunit (family B)